MLERLSSRDKALLVLAGFLGVLSVALIATSVHAEPRPVTGAVMPELLRKHSHETHRGYEPSSYRGRWFDKRTEPIRKCIGTRESHFQYMLSDGGTYQFMASNRWPVSLAWMMKKETRHDYGKTAANRMFRVLSRHEVNQWSRFWQDQAFWVVWRHGKGAKHWLPTVPGTGCF